MFVCVISMSHFKNRWQYYQYEFTLAKRYKNISQVIKNSHSQGKKTLAFG